MRDAAGQSEFPDSPDCVYGKSRCILMDVRWPKLGPQHRGATETCLNLIDAHRSTDDAGVAFREAAEEANMRKR